MPPHSIKLIYYSVIHKKEIAALVQGTSCTPDSNAEVVLDFEIFHDPHGGGVGLEARTLP